MAPRTPRGIRNNNPGNIDFNQAAYERDPWVGETGLENHKTPRFTTFSRPTYGIRALCKILLTYHHKRRADDGSDIDTVQEIIDRWAPPTENESDAYARQVREGLGVKKGEIIDLDDHDTMEAITREIIEHENGEMPYSDEIVRAGVEMAMLK